ncbi:MAG: N-acetyl-gamma-glutamyl-phosphate reductase, partial [Candidatus Brocadiia bacterium]
TEQLQKVLGNFYSDAPFVRVRTADDQPRTKSVAFTNFCDIAGVVRRGRRVVLTAAIDNLMKGAASQAVQNMNVMFGLDQTAGLL